MLTALPFLIVYFTLSILLWISDQRTGLLPDRFTCPLLWSGLLYHQCCLSAGLPDAVWGAMAGYVVLAFLYWIYRWLYHKEGLGYGDVKFLAALGAWHGWQSLPVLVFLAALFACVFTLVLFIRRGKAVLKNPLPFGPFLATAGFIVSGQTLLAGILSLPL